MLAAIVTPDITRNRLPDALGGVLSRNNHRLARRQPRVDRSGHDTWPDQPEPPTNAAHRRSAASTRTPIGWRGERAGGRRRRRHLRLRVVQEGGATPPSLGGTSTRRTGGGSRGVRCASTCGSRPAIVSGVGATLIAAGSWPSRSESPHPRPGPAHAALKRREGGPDGGWDAPATPYRWQHPLSASTVPPRRGAPGRCHPFGSGLRRPPAGGGASGCGRYLVGQGGSALSAMKRCRSRPWPCDRAERYPGPEEAGLRGQHPLFGHHRMHLGLEPRTQRHELGPDSAPAPVAPGSPAGRSTRPATDPGATCRPGRWHRARRS
jgi:hypothetical protein